VKTALLWIMLIAGYVGGCYFFGFAVGYPAHLSPLQSQAIIALVPIILLARGVVWTVRSRTHSDRRVRNLVGKSARGLSVCLAVFVLWYWGSGTYYIGVRARPTSEKAECLDNLVELREVLSSYVADRDSFPSANTWCVELDLRHIDITGWSCPSAETIGWTYAFNEHLGDAAPGSVVRPRAVVALFESDAGWNAAGGPELLPEEPRHFGGDNYLFADGHIAWIPRKRLGTDEDGNAIWAKEPARDEAIWEPVLKESEGEAAAPADP
jgi:prepilin-type processing-associated H-X9-DG protein